jgi:hypothetical protein
MVLVKLTQMVVAYNCCAHLLLVLVPTGGVISAVQDTFALLLADVMLTSLPLLSLDTDQTKKVMKNASLLEFGLVTAFHLDTIEDPAMQQDLLMEKLMLLVSS